MRTIWPSFLLIMLPCLVTGQCDPHFDTPLSIRNANYRISLELDHIAKQIDAQEQLTWINTSPDTLNEMRFYMYLNAFKNSESTFLKGASEIFGQQFSNRPPNEWGWIRIDSIGREGGQELTGNLQYLHDDDQNALDQSILQVMLDQPVLPGDTLVLHMRFTAKIPKIFARTGYSKDDYFLLTHWFPQACVYQINLDGEWGWNSHQFHRMTEFFADFGTYDVEITAAPHLVLGASGCEVNRWENTDGTITRQYRAEDVIDFAWTAYPCFDTYEKSWNHVLIRLLIPPEHSSMADRYIEAVEHSLDFMTRHVGPYPYPTITIVDPPFHALRSGLMEYPTLITAGTFYQMPPWFRNSEALAAHEFAHQYFMAMVASNEKEEAWLDEGLVTYFEDRIIDNAYGKKRSLIDLFGYRYDSEEKTRLEYTTMPNPKIGIVARPSWEFTESYKELIYSKTATALHTLQNLAGETVMDQVFMTYFERWKFRHPKGKDFLAVLEEVLTKELGPAEGKQLYDVFWQILYTTDVCDYSAGSINNQKVGTRTGWFDQAGGELNFRTSSSTSAVYLSEVILYRKGDMIVPQEVAITFENGATIKELWDGSDRRKVFAYNGSSRIMAVHIDPDQDITLDVDLNNNSLTLEPKRSPLLRYSTRAIFWIQNVLQVVGFLV